MKVDTALSFLCLGAGLWLAGNDERQRTRSILGLLVVIIAGSTLAEYAFHINLGIDQLLFRDTRTPSLSAYPGRMAIATAICLVLLGSAVMFLGLKKALVLQRALVVACFAFSLVALCGYLYGAESLYAITSFSTVGVHTSAGLVAVCLAYFLARPNEGLVSIAASDSNSGFLLRTPGPAIVVVPILIGWLKLAGQRARLYDTPFGTALLVLVSIGCLAALTMLVARSMYRWECESSHSEKMIRESEGRFRLVADTAPALIWTSGINKLCTYVNKSWLDFTGRSIVFELGNGWAEGVHPEDLQRCLDNYTQSFDRRAKFRMEYRRLRHDGEYRWILDIGVPRLDQDRSFVGYIGIGVDITELKLAEAALANVSRKLIEAQEQERTRIGRELHDDINQRLAMLAIEIAQLQASPSEVRPCARTPKADDRNLR
jgi:PAS domain S-box-containing protein